MAATVLKVRHSQCKPARAFISSRDSRAFINGIPDNEHGQVGDERFKLLVLFDQLSNFFPEDIHFRPDVRDFRIRIIVDDKISFISSKCSRLLYRSHAKSSSG